MLTRVIIYIHNNISLLSYIFKTDDITMDMTAAIEDFDIFDDLVPSGDIITIASKLKLAVVHLEKHMMSEVAAAKGAGISRSMLRR